MRDWPVKKKLLEARKKGVSCYIVAEILVLVKIRTENILNKLSD